MPKHGSLQSPMQPVAPIPDGRPAGDGGTVGGFDLEEGGKETPNTVSGLPRQRTTFPVKGGASGPGEQVEMPPVKSPGTFKSGGVKAVQTGQIVLVRTNPAAQFTTALAQNAKDTEDMVIGSAVGQVDAGVAAGLGVKSRLKHLTVVSVQNLAWEVWLWRTDAYDVSLTNPALVFPAGRWAFLTTDAVRIGAAGLYYYYIEGTDQFYEDHDNTGEVHLMLVNRSATAKGVAGAGLIAIELGLEPCLGW